MPRHPPALRARVIALADTSSAVEAAQAHGIHVNTVRKWLRARRLGVDTSPSPSPSPSRAGTRASLSRGMFEAEAHRRGVTLRALVEEVLGGIWLPDGEPVDDIALVYRIPGIDDLGRAAMHNTSRPGTGGGGGKIKGRTGRTQSQGRREGEHA